MSIFFQSLKVKYIGKFWQKFKNFEIYTGLFRHSKLTLMTIKIMTLILREAGKTQTKSKTWRLRKAKINLKSVRKTILKKTDSLISVQLTKCNKILNAV